MVMTWGEEAASLAGAAVVVAVHGAAVSKVMSESPDGAHLYPDGLSAAPIPVGQEVAAMMEARGQVALAAVHDQRRGSWQGQQAAQPAQERG